MADKKLWTKEQEIDFFTKSLEIASPEQLFYTTKDKKYYAYWPKSYKGTKTTLQSRNAFIGAYTEKWSQEILKDIAKELNAHAVRNVVCEELELTKDSPADVAICKTDSVIQKSSNILAVFEVKMSIIPILILGNTPVSKSYYTKVDNLKNYGIIQGFWSLNPAPLDNNGENVKTTKNKGFLRFDSYSEFRDGLLGLLKEDMMFFAGMRPKNDLGKFIEVANKEDSYEKKAEKFLNLMREANGK